MSDSISKVIVSHGRAGRVKTLSWLPSAKLCVSESQAELYRRAYPDTELIVHPDSVVGLPPKRNWLYHELGDVFQLDDDLKEMVGLFTSVGEKTVKPSGDYADALIDRAYGEACEAGAYLFGFSNFVHPAAYNPLRPYRITGLVYGLGFGIRKSDKLYWHPELKILGDYWISLLNAYHHRVALVDNRWAFVPIKTFKQTGGLSMHRTEAAEAADNDLLKRTFGDALVLSRTKTPLAKRHYEVGRRIKVPF